MASADCVVLGASFDTPAQDKAFAKSQGFDSRLLCDVDRTVGDLYEVARGPDEQYPDYPLRIAYLIDPAGTVRMAYKVDDVEGFANNVLADLDKLQDG